MSKKTSTEKTPIEIKRHSLAHLLAAAVLDMFPEAKLGIGPNIESGFYYDFELPRTLIPEDLPLLEKKMKNILKQGVAFEKSEMDIEAAFTMLHEKGQHYKSELVADLKESGEKVASFYHTTGGQIDFTDLCAGPHIETGKELDQKAFKLDKIAGAYWKGSEKNKMLQRIYALAFDTADELNEYIEKRKAAEKNDHRKLGKELEYFTISEKVGAGLPLWLPKGEFVRHALTEYMREKEIEAGYQYVHTPEITHEELYKTSGHLDHYHDDMYAPIDIDGENYYLRPMNCPHHHMVFASSPKSYRDLPFRMAEHGTVYRYERSGVLTGLIRARCFTQNDSHIYCAKSQLKNEILGVLKLFEIVYKDFDISDYWFRLSLPDFSNQEKFGDTDNTDLWEYSAEVAREALKEYGAKYEEVIGEASFYGPKIDVQTRNVMGKEDTIATVQVDFFMGTRFGLEFINEKGEKETPFIVHRAIMGSFERFFAFLLEKCGGNLPLWLAPMQVAILPVAEAHMDYAETLKKSLIKEGLRVQIFDAETSLGKRIRNSELSRIPYMLVCGDAEVESGGVTARDLKTRDQVAMSVADFVKQMKQQIQEKK